MAANPIDEAATLLEAMQERWCASTAGKDGSRRIATFDTARGIRGEDDFDNEVFATRRCASDLALAIERIRALTAAHQQGGGEVVAWIEPVAGTIRKYTPEQYESNKDMLHKHGWRPLVYGDTAPPSAPVGVDYAKRLATALWQQHYREDAPQWEPFDDIMGLLSQIDNMVSGLSKTIALAQQPAAVDEAMTQRIMSESHANDPGDIWPPHEQGRMRRKALQDAINNALATQHQEPTT